MTRDPERERARIASPGERLQFFESEGYLVVEDVLSAEELKACEDEIERLHDLYGELAEKDDPSLSYFQKEPYANDAGDRRPVLRKIEETRSLSALFKDLSSHPGLVAVIQDLLGPDLLLFRSTLMLKPALHGSIHGLHQDSAYWPMEPPTLVTVSIALNDTTEENGCIQVIPRSHLGGVQEWGQIARDQEAALTDRDDLDDSQLVNAPVRAGTALMFHSRLVHGSGPNRSPNPRHTALYAYFPPTVRYCPPDGKPPQKTFPVIAGLEGKTELVLTAADPTGDGS